jgi:hypothetical protein
MRRMLVSILATMILIACSGCFWGFNHDGHGHGDGDHGGYGDHDQGGGHDQGGSGGHDQGGSGGHDGRH